MEHVTQRRRKVVPEMEGTMARWYARQRGSAPQLALYRRQAAELTRDLAPGSAILEVAPGPGYLSIELARLGRFRVSAVDISATFVDLATAQARRSGVSVAFRRGDAADLPYPAGSFDLVICQAAFKNFTEPVRALDEMYRVLRPGGTAVIDDLRREATRDDIAREVAGMRIGAASGAWTRMALGWLRRRAYTAGAFTALAGHSAFGRCEIASYGVGQQITLVRDA